MFNTRRLHFFSGAFIVLLLTACSSTPHKKVVLNDRVAQDKLAPVELPKPIPPKPKIIVQAPKPIISTPAPEPIVTIPLRPEGNVGFYNAEMITGDYAGYASTRRFIDRLSSQHGFDANYLKGLFSEAERKDFVLRLMNKQAPSKGGKKRPGNWSSYRKKFITSSRIRQGAAFWDEHADTLARAETEFGVPAEIIVGIIGVETVWGRNFGKTSILDALTTLSFDYPRRARYFSTELEKFLIMSRDEKFDPKEKRGSYAGAMGYGQFMPSSFIDYAVDFNNDGKRDLWNPVDAIGSVANYFQSHGWQSGEPVIISARSKGKKYRSLDWGFKTKYSLAKLKRYGVRPLQQALADTFSLIRFRTTKGEKIWLGMKNFYVITRYNHSSKYAMAVYQLGQKVKKRHFGG